MDHTDEDETGIYEVLHWQKMKTLRWLDKLPPVVESCRFDANEKRVNKTRIETDNAPKMLDVYVL